MDITGKKSFIINLLFYSSLIILLWLAAKFLFSYMLPFVIAVVVAAAVQKPAKCLSLKVKFKKSVIALFLAALVYILIILLLFFVARWAVLFAKGLIPNIMDTLENISEAVISAYKKTGDKILGEQQSKTFTGFINSSLSEFGSAAVGLLSNFVAVFAKSIPSFFVSSIVTFVASCYIARDYDKLKMFISGIFGEGVKAKAVKIISILQTNILKIVKGYLILMGVVFAELSVGFWLLGFKNPVLIALITSFIDLLPVFGVGAVLIPLGIILFLLGKSGSALGVAILYLLVSLVRNFAEPKIVGERLGIHPLFTLVSMFVGLKIAGVFGLFLFPIGLIVVYNYYRKQ